MVNRKEESGYNTSKKRSDKVIYKAERTELLTRPPKPLVTIPDEDFEWLVEHVKEQAEKFQELRKRYLILTKENNQVNDELIDEFRKNKRYRDLLKRIDYLLEKAGETDEDIYGLARHIRGLIYLEGEE